MDFDDMSFDEVKALYKGKERLINDVLSPVDAANLSRYESELQYIETRIKLMKERDEKDSFLERDLNDTQMMIKDIYIRGINELSEKETEKVQREILLQSRAEEKVKKQKRIVDMIKSSW